MSPRHAERRIIYSLVVILIAIQLAIFFVLRVNNARIARAALDEALQTGAHVTRSLLETRQKQLDESTRVLAGDFGLRQAIASGDRPTVASMLDNHEQRAHGTFVAVHDLGQQVLARSTRLPPGQALDALAPEASPPAALRLAALDRRGDTLFHLSSAEVRAPSRLAWISIGVMVDAGFAAELSRLTGLQYMFVARNHAGQWRLHGSSLPAAVTAAAMRQVEAGDLATPRREGWTVDTAQESYLLASLPLGSTGAGAGEVVAVIGKSLDHAMAPMREVERGLLALIAASLLLSIGAYCWVTARMVAPITDSAHRDTLTGLLNRGWFDACLRQAIDDARRKHLPLCVLMMDLDKFKAINDDHGHAAGDEALRVFARRLQQAVRSTDTVARLGGDEFAVILPGADRAAVLAVIDNLVPCLGQPFSAAGQTLSLSASIGIGVMPDDGIDPGELLGHADQAMYAAKLGRTGHAFHVAASPPAAPAPGAARVSGFDPSVA